MSSDPESQMFDLIDLDVSAYARLDLAYRQAPQHTQSWNEIIDKGTKKLLSEDGRVNRDVVRNFRRNKLFVSDNPVIGLTSGKPDQEMLELVNYEKELCKTLMEILHGSGDLDLLARYPSCHTGNPQLYHVEVKGTIYKFTHRWFKDIYKLGTLTRYLGSCLQKGFISLDIGSCYGIFQSLVHREFPGCHQILVDIPEQLVLARYFLTSNFPDARIAGILELEKLQSITPEFIRNYDFILLPADWYNRMAPDSIDLLTSFACLGELSRQYFDNYVQHPAFSTARYIYIASQIAPTRNSRHSGDSEITILDFPIADPKEKIYFGLSPVYVRSYGFKPGSFPPFFEYIGKH